jgi:hypothetical protein
MNYIRVVLLNCVSCMLIPGMTMAQKDTTQKQQIQQVEIVTFKPGTSEADRHMVDSSFRNSLNQLPVVHTFLSVVAHDGQNSNQVKHVYITTFNSKGDLETYNASPQHKAVKKTNAAYIDNVVIVDYPVNK